MNNQLRTLRWPGVWLAGAWLLVAAVVVLSLVPIPADVSAGRSDKIAHLVAYGILMFGFTQIYLSGRARIVTAVGLALLGVALEVLQGHTGYRSFDLADMAANALGVLLGWGLGPPRTVNLVALVERVL